MFSRSRKGSRGYGSPSAATYAESPGLGRDTRFGLLDPLGRASPKFPNYSATSVNHYELDGSVPVEKGENIFLIQSVARRWFVVTSSLHESAIPARPCAVYIFTLILTTTRRHLANSIASGTFRGPAQRSTASVRSGRSSESTSQTIRTSTTMTTNADRRGNRRERTFVGSECAVCEEPLEHTLRGERILQFSCSHVSHEACFYEFIREFESQYCPTCNAPLHLDTSRGGNVLDIGES